MKKMIMRCAGIMMLVCVFSIQGMAQRLRKLMPTRGQSTQRNTSGVKDLFSYPLFKQPSLQSLVKPYQKIKDQLSSLSVNPMTVSKMAFTLMTGIPIFVIDLDKWKGFGKNLFSWMLGEKLIFTQVYQKSPLNLAQLNKDGLFKELEKLASLRSLEKQSMHNEYKYEHEYTVEAGEGSESNKWSQANVKLHADAWLFGATYHAAIRNAETIDDIKLLYESACTWLRLRIESGLYDDAASLDAEFDLIDQQVEKIMNKYDEQSIPVVKQYLKDIRQDFKDKFAQWLEGRKRIMVIE